MGNDFISKAAKAFKKSWSKGQQKISGTDLFTIFPEHTTVTVKATPCDGHTFETGAKYTLELIAGGFDVYRETQIVGRCPNPAQSILIAVERCGGKALGTVDNVYNLTGNADLIIR